MHRSLIIFGVLSFWIILKPIYNDAVVFKFTNAVCESYNKSWFTISECRLRAISRNKTTFNFNGTVLHPANDIYVEGQIFKKANGYKPWLYKFNLNACRFVKKAYNPFVILAFKQIKEFTNFNHTCPYMGVQLVRGFYLRAKVFRLPMPTGEYLFKMNWIFDNKTQFYTNLYILYEEDL